MFSRLNINIAVNLALILGLAMFLVDAVMVTSSRKLAIEDEILRAKLFMSAVVCDDKNINEKIQNLLTHSGFAAALILDAKKKPRYFNAKKPLPCRAELTGLARQAVKTRQHFTRLTGETWGIFIKQPHYLISVQPIGKNRAVGVVSDLSSIYARIRQSQKMLLTYALINMAALILLGLYRLSKIFVKPMQRLLDRVESYQEDDGGFFPAEKGDNEFNQLSRALSQMVYRISESKTELRGMVKSLGKANADLKKAQNDVINAEKLASVGRLSAGIAHEIGNPIAIVTGYLELINREDVEDEERREVIVRIQNEISRIHAIIHQLLDFSRPATENIQTISVHDILNDILDVFQYQPFMKNIQIKTSLNAEKYLIQADPSQLRQVFLNLMMNAVDAISPDDLDSSITICTKDHNDFVKICFNDTGTGIAEKNLNNIFDPFYTTKAPGKGTGLGLSVCFTIIDAMGGKINVFSKEGQGASICLHLPITDIKA